MLAVERLPDARADQLDIWLYIASDSVRAADRLLDHLDEAVLMLARHPDAGRARPDLVAGLRSYAVESFVVFYRHHETTLTIVRVLSAYRDIGPDKFG